MIGLDSNLRLLPLQVLKAYGVLISGHLSAETGSFATPDFAHAILLDGLRLGPRRAHRRWRNKHCRSITICWEKPGRHLPLREDAT